MTDEYVEQRRHYVQKVRDSFSEPKDGRTRRGAAFGAGAESEDELETAGAFAIWKVKMLIAAMLLFAFVFCDRTNTPLFSVPTETIVKQLKENDLLPAMKKEIEKIQEYLK